jgi:predicted PurR-regulated permease PerM
MPDKYMKNMPSIKIWRLAGTGILLAGALFFLYKVRRVFTPFLLAALLAYMLKPAVQQLEKKGLKRPAAILLMYLLVLGVSLPVVFFVLPRLLTELNDFMKQLPLFTVEIEGLFQGFYERYNQVKIPASMRQLIDEAIVNISAAFHEGAKHAAQFLLDLVAGIASFLLAPILAYYLLRDSEHIGRSASRLLPLELKEDVLGLWVQLDRVLTNFIHGNLLLSLLVGFMTGIGLFLIGSEYAVILAVIVGLADLIPYFGPLIGAIPVVALSLLQSKQMALYAMIVMVVVQQLEEGYLSPRILGECVSLHPLVVVFALLAGGELWGVTGLLLGVPLVAMGRIILSFIWSRLVSS